LITLRTLPPARRLCGHVYLLTDSFTADAYFDLAKAVHSPARDGLEGGPSKVDDALTVLGRRYDAIRRVCLGVPRRLDVFPTAQAIALDLPNIR
jgi:hypothetical protein